MKNNRIDIDKLFADARSESPVMTEDEVRLMLEEKIKPAGDFSSKKLFKGDKKMLGILGLSIAAIGIIFWNVVNLDDSTQSDVNALKHTTQESITNNDKVIESKSKKSDDKQVIPIDDERMTSNRPVSKEGSEKGLKNSSINEMNSDIKGIKSIVLNQNELKDLGITVDNGGQFIEVYMSKKKAVPTKIYVDWGVGYNSNDKQVDLPDKYIIPRMITDNHGMRRIEVFSDDKTDISIDQLMGPMMLGGKQNTLLDEMAALWSDKEIWDGTQFNSEKFSEKLTKLMDKNSAFFNKLQINQDSAKNIAKMFQDLNPEEVKKIAAEMSQLKEQMKNINIKINSTALDSSENNQKITETKHVMIIMDQNSNPNDTNTKIDKDVRVLVDKRDRNSDGTVKDDRNIHITFDDVKMEPISITLPALDINKLLSVEVPIPNAVDKNGKKLENFSFILWLNLDEETYKNLPERIRNQVKPEYDALTKTEGAVCGYSPNENGENYLDIWRTCDGAIENVTASPNPTTGNVNLSFILKENRNITITINDVFGKKVQDVVVNQRMPKGENFHGFNISGVEAGMYLIVVQTNAGEQAVHRVIVKD